MRASRTVLVVAAVSLAEAVRHWIGTPPVMASHFGPSGMPDAYAPRTVFFGLHVMVTALILLLTVGIPATLDRVPTRLINLPHRDYWLDPIRREASLRTIAAYFASFGTFTLFLIIATFELAVAANNRPDRRFDTSFFWLILAVYVIFVAFRTVRFIRYFASVPAGAGTAT